MGKVLKFKQVETPWTARRIDEYGCGIIVGRFHNGAFEDINFETFAEYLTWKKVNNVKVIENW
jgi:hypothetical protein